MSIAVEATKPSLSLWGWLLRIVGSLVLLAVILTTAVMAYAVHLHNRNTVALAAELQAIHDLGEPVDGAELNSSYRVPVGIEDITDAYVGALQPMRDKKLQHELSELKLLCNLTVVGKEPPHRPDVWQQLAQAEQSLAPFEIALVEIKDAAKRSGRVCYPADYSDGNDAPLPYIQPALRMTRILELDLLRNYYREDFERVTEVLLTAIALAESFHYEPAIVAQLARNQILRSARKWTAFLAADSDFPSSELRRLQAAFESVTFEEAFRIANLGDRAILISTFDLPVKDKSLAEDWDVPIGTVLAKLYPGDCVALLQWQNRNVEISRLPFLKALEAARLQWDDLQEVEPSERIPHWLQSHFDPEAFLDAVKQLRWFGREECENRGTVIMCAVERYRREHQRQPKTLSELVPDLLPSVPLDPYMEAQPMSFEAKEDQSYAIYSFGTNHFDDHGDLDGETYGSDFGVKSFTRLPTTPEMPQ